MTAPTKSHGRGFMCLLPTDAGAVAHVTPATLPASTVSPVRRRKLPRCALLRIGGFFAKGLM
jgi:hypothetical protein